MKNVNKAAAAVLSVLTLAGATVPSANAVGTEASKKEVIINKVKELAKNPKFVIPSAVAAVLLGTAGLSGAGVGVALFVKWLNNSVRKLKKLAAKTDKEDELKDAVSSFSVLLSKMQKSRPEIVISEEKDKDNAAKNAKAADRKLFSDFCASANKKIDAFNSGAPLTKDDLLILMAEAIANSCTSSQVEKLKGEYQNAVKALRDSSTTPNIKDARLVVGLEDTKSVSAETEPVITSAVNDVNQVINEQKPVVKENRKEEPKKEVKEQPAIEVKEAPKAEQ